MTDVELETSPAAAGDRTQTGRRWMSTAVTGVLVILAVLGVALIYIGAQQDSAFARELLIGVGAAIGPAAMVTIVLRAFLLGDLEREFVTPLTGQVQRSLDQALPRQVNGVLDEVTGILEGYRNEVQGIDAIRKSGLVLSYPNRQDAMLDFLSRCLATPKPVTLVVVGSSLKGILPDEYCPFAEVIRRDPNAVKFVLTHPVVADLRAQQEGRQPTAIGEEIVERLRVLERLGVPAPNVYLYRGTPTCFGIMSPDLNLMLLNPYPYEAVAFDAPCLLVRRKEDSSSYLYESFRINHFSRIEARSVMTEQLQDLGLIADALEQRLERYKEVAQLVEQLAPLPHVSPPPPSQLFNQPSEADEVVAVDEVVATDLDWIGDEPKADVVVYVDSDDRATLRQVLDAVGDLADELGYEPPSEDSISPGSLLWRGRTTPQRGRVGELSSRLDDVEQALQAHLAAKDAEVGQVRAATIARLVDSLADVPRAFVRIDRLVVVKFTENDEPMLQARLLSPDELRAIEVYPELENKPESFFVALPTAVAGLDIETTPSPDGRS